MRFAIAFLFLIAALPAYAGQPEARDAARQNNCPPKKIEIYQSQLGGSGKVIYQVTCTMPKTTDKDAQGGPDALLIECEQSLCTLLRPVALDKK